MCALRFNHFVKPSFLAMLTLLLVLATAHASVPVRDSRRPVYIIGHMVNSIEEVKEYLDRGSNVLESDISFYNNGSVKRVYHGSPCDCNRTCTKSAELSSYLDYLRKITNHASGAYSERMVFQFFDLKLDNVSPSGKLQAGQEMADHILENLWKNITPSDKDKVIRVLIYINRVSDRDAVVGFKKRFKERGVEDFLQNVGFDGGMGELEQVEDMWSSIEVDSHVWQGDGSPNCLSPFYPDHRLKNEIHTRDTSHGYIDKVYHWTIDDENRMRKSLGLRVDGMITNVPEKLVEILQDQQFSGEFRLATVDDDPFLKYIPNEKPKE